MVKVQQANEAASMRLTPKARLGFKARAAATAARTDAPAVREVSSGSAPFRHSSRYLNASDLETTDQLNISALSRCIVNLLSSPALTSLHLVDLQDCIVLAPPASSSVFVARCTGCTLILAGQQVRTACERSARR